MRLNWKKLAKNIPTKVQVGAKSEYEVLWIPDFHGTETFGETRFDTKQIVIRSGMGPKITVETFYHEFCHALSYEHGLNLTEPQVLQMEATFPYMMRIMEGLKN